METLLSPSGILLYGRLVADLKVTHAAGSGDDEPEHRPFVSVREGANLLLQRQLHEKDAQFARIYGFSYEGHYYDLPKPALFLVHGIGEPAEDLVKEKPNTPAAEKPHRQSRGPDVADKTGIAAQEYSFSEDMRVWSYDKGDFSIRMDVETGPFEQVLLEAMLRPDQLQSYYGGADLRGADLRMRGADLRVSGADLRLRRGRSD